MTTTRRRRNPRGEGERLREDLVTAASTLLETRPGEEALSLRAVARQAGVSAPSVYLHFADKSALMHEVLRRRLAELRDELDAAAAGAPDPLAELRARCLAYCDYAAARPGHYRMMFTAIPSGSSDEGELPGIDMPRRLGELARAAGCPGDPAQIGAVLWCGLHGIVALRESKPRFPWPPRDDLVEALVTSVVGAAPTRS